MGKTVRVNVTNETVMHWLIELRRELDREAEIAEEDLRDKGSVLTARLYRAMRSRTLTGDVAEAVSATVRLLELLPDCLSLGTAAELIDVGPDSEPVAQAQE